jgi:uncharacterized protein
MRIVELWRHPVKSAQGLQVDEVTIDQRGFVGDRRWGLRDVATGNILTGRREPRLLFLIGGDGNVTLPSGVPTADDQEISAWLDREVRLVGTSDEVRSTYEVPLDPLGSEQQWVSWQGPAGSFLDSTRTAVSMVSAPALRNWDHRRFRMNIVFDETGDTDLIGKRILLGTAVLDVVKPVDRCVMVTRPQPNLERDLDVLKAINADHEGNLGVGAIVVEPGVVRLEDAVTIVT